MLPLLRVTHDISLVDPAGLEGVEGFSGVYSGRKSICGILGVARIVSGPALILAVKSKKVSRT